MKILFLANRIPYPPYRGDKLKIFNLAKRLASKHELYLLTFTETKSDWDYKTELEKIFKEVHLVHLPKWQSALNCLKHLLGKMPFQVAYFQSSALKIKLDQLIKKHQFDAIHVQHLRMAPYLNKRKDLPRILDLPDAFSLYWERRSKVKRNWITTVFETIEKKRVLAYESILKDYQMSLVCSQEDLNYLKQKHQVDNLRLLPNGVDLSTFSGEEHDYQPNKVLLFTGNMDYAPNVDAVIYFVQEMLPEIIKVHPQVKFIIAGQRPIEKVKALAAENVEITGFVKDLKQVYQSASVVVAPLRFGAGTQNKVLEAMSMGVPVVCSEIGFAGLGIQSGEGVIMQTEKMLFIESICDLLSNENLRKSVGKAGKRVIVEKFDWEIIAAQLEQYFKNIN